MAGKNRVRSAIGRAVRAVHAPANRGTGFSRRVFLRRAAAGALALKTSGLINGFRAVASPPAASQASHATHLIGGMGVFCIDRRVNKPFIAKALRDARVDRAIVLSFENAYAPSSAGNLVRRDVLPAMALAFNPEHPGQLIAIVGHDKKCGGMGALQKMLIGIQEGRTPAEFAKDPHFGPLFEQLAADVEKHASFLEAVKRVKGGTFGNFLRSETMREALEEWNLFVQHHNAMQLPSYATHNETVRTAGGHAIRHVAGVYSPAHVMANGHEMSVPGSVRFRYDKVVDALGGPKTGFANLRKLLDHLGLEHVEASPFVTQKRR